jgi:hypothetical protein
MEKAKYNIYFASKTSVSFFDYREPTIIIWPESEDEVHSQLGTRFAYKVIDMNEAGPSEKIHLAFEECKEGYEQTAAA